MRTSSADAGCIRKGTVPERIQKRGHGQASAVSETLLLSPFCFFHPFLRAPSCDIGWGSSFLPAAGRSLTPLKGPPILHQLPSFNPPFSLLLLPSSFLPFFILSPSSFRHPHSSTFRARPDSFPRCDTGHITYVRYISRPYASIIVRY